MKEFSDGWYVGEWAWPDRCHNKLSAGRFWILVQPKYVRTIIFFENCRTSYFDPLDVTETDEYEANWGILDQQEALKWVNNFIHMFNGDSNRVTLSGCSAGLVFECVHFIRATLAQCHAVGNNLWRMICNLKTRSRRTICPNSFCCGEQLALLLSSYSLFCTVWNSIFRVSQKFQFSHFFRMVWI